jgi:hypothetical protein
MTQLQILIPRYVCIIYLNLCARVPESRIKIMLRAFRIDLALRALLWWHNKTVRGILLLAFWCAIRGLFVLVFSF